MAYEIRARSLGEILDGGVQLYRNHFRSFLTTTAAISIPSLLLARLVTWLLTGSLSATASPPAEATGFGRAFAPLATLPITFAFGLLLEAMLTIAIADAYLGRTVSIRTAWQRILAQLKSLAGAGILKGLAVMGGFVLLIVPGILMMLNWLFTTQAITVEGLTARAALARSKELARGGRGKLAGLLLLLAIINAALVHGFGALIPESVRALPLLGAFLQQLPSILIGPLTPAVITLAYFDARVRKEAFDLEMLSDAIGPGAPVAATAAVHTA
jgi:hypothetical protein